MFSKRYIQFVDDLAKLYGVHVKIANTPVEIKGEVFDNPCADMETDTIYLIFPEYLYKRVGGKELMPAFFHELAHVLNKYEGKYSVYHSTINPNKDSIESLNIYIKTALKAERYTESRAKELMSFWCPYITYEEAYRDKVSVMYLDYTQVYPVRLAIAVREEEREYGR